MHLVNFRCSSHYFEHFIIKCTAQSWLFLCAIYLGQRAHKSWPGNGDGDGDGLAQQQHHQSRAEQLQARAKVKCYPQSAHKTLKCHKRDFYYVLCAERAPRAEVIPFIYHLVFESGRVQGMANDESRKKRELSKLRALFLAGYAVVNLRQLQHTLSLFLSPPTRLKMLPGCLPASGTEFPSCLSQPDAIYLLHATLTLPLPSPSCSFLLLAQLMQIVCLLPGHVGVSQSSRHASKTVIRRGRRQ